MPEWHDLGPADDLKDRPLRQITVGRTKLAVSYVDGTFGAVSGVCNHVGGPIGDGTLAGEYIVCPWHHWTYHCRTGLGEPGYEEDAVPSHDVEVRDGHVWVDLKPASKRSKGHHDKHPLDREPTRADGPLRVVGISTTVMDRKYPRTSTSELLLMESLAAASEAGAETRLLRLDDLSFRNCEGYYSKSAHACTWPCSITQMDKNDEMTEVYEALVFWADVVILATPIRWGNASSLYYKMAERLNCVQNQITIRDRVMIRNKTAAFIITGGQDNIQGVAGQLLTFFGELGFMFPQFPFIAHSRGWSAEDMERNIAYVVQSDDLKQGARALAERALETAHVLLEHGDVHAKTERRGRKASGMIEALPMAPRAAAASAGRTSSSSPG
jgi:nitrite reductase/ring-hydroxylating ferredoxin subunit/multimeric flavodoxin WrbA